MHSKQKQVGKLTNSPKRICCAARCGTHNIHGDYDEYTNKGRRRKKADKRYLFGTWVFRTYTEYAAYCTYDYSSRLTHTFAKAKAGGQTTLINYIVYRIAHQQNWLHAVSSIFLISTDGCLDGFTFAGFDCNEYLVLGYDQETKKSCK